MTTTATAEARKAVVDSIFGEVMAQLDELSDDTMSLVGEVEADGEGNYSGPLFDLAEDLRETLAATLAVRFSDWCADNDLDAGTDADVLRRFGD